MTSPTQTNPGPMERGVADCIIGEHVFTKRLLSYAREQDAIRADLLAALEDIGFMPCAGEGACSSATRTVEHRCSGCSFNDKRRAAIAKARGQ